MTNLIRPILTNDGIELYVADSEDCGMSIAGIARFVGKHKRLIGVAINVIKQLQCGEEISKINEDAMVTEDIRRLEMFVYKGLDSEEVVLPINAIKNATVVNSNAVALIVQYYAYYAKNQTDIAKISHGKFANIGIKSWIKTTAGVDQIAFNNQATMLEVLANATDIITKCQAQIERLDNETRGYRAVRVTLPGLEQWFNSLSDADCQQLALPSADNVETYSIVEAIEELYPGTVLNNSIKHKLAIKMSQTMEVMQLHPVPDKEVLNGKGYPMKVKAYAKHHLPLIKMVYAMVLSST